MNILMIAFLFGLVDDPFTLFFFVRSCFYFLLMYFKIWPSDHLPEIIIRSFVPVVHNSYSYGGFLKWGTPKTIGFNTKVVYIIWMIWDILHFRKFPYTHTYIYIRIYIYMYIYTYTDIVYIYTHVYVYRRMYPPQNFQRLQTAVLNERPVFQDSPCASASSGSRRFRRRSDGGLLQASLGMIPAVDITIFGASTNGFIYSTIYIYTYCIYTGAKKVGEVIFYRPLYVYIYSAVNLPLIYIYIEPIVYLWLTPTS